MAGNTTPGTFSTWGRFGGEISKIILAQAVGHGIIRQPKHKMSLQSDIQAYKAISKRVADIYAEIGTDQIAARLRREERWSMNAAKREAAENIIMAMIGEHKPALQRAGLVDLYEEMAAGKHESDAAFYAIVDTTVKYYDGKK